MKNQLFIPDRIKVGFQIRPDTYSKKLAYITYYDEKKQLRKSKSWNSWCDPKIDSVEYDNTPHDGFVLNKDVKRSSEWFSSGRNMIRVYDDRGFEFEITTGNLLFILMTTNCLKREFQGQFVYAWHKTELVLLPVNCEEYNNSTTFSKLQNKSIKTKELVEGCSYKTKKQNDVVYLGKFEWLSLLRKPSKILEYYSRTKLVFVDENGNFIPANNTQKLAERNTDTPVSNYAQLVDDFLKTPRASKAVGLQDSPTNNDDLFYVKVNDGTYHQFMKIGYFKNKYFKRYTISFSNKNVMLIWNTSYENAIAPFENKCDLLVTLENGNAIPFEEFLKIERCTSQLK